MKFVIKNAIYQAVEPYNHNSKQDAHYDCFIPCMSGKFEIVDCWVCNAQDNVHPGYNVSGVPVHTDNLGEIIGQFETEE